MILLILVTVFPSLSTYEKFKFHYDSINSMIQKLEEENGKKFKFHYDSINSIIFTAIPGAFILFKFHYDSINSKVSLHRKDMIKNLNSIMILLIQKVVFQFFLLPFHLNSIMILLIL